MINVFKNKYEIIIRKCFLHIKHYNKIIDINSNKIKIEIDNNTLVISGASLIVCAMNEYELVIKGCIKSIEFINE